MPRKTKDIKENKEKEIEKKPVTKSTKKASVSSKKSNETNINKDKKASKVAKKTTTKKSATKTTSKTTAKKSATKATSKTTAKKSATKATTKTTAKKSATKATSKTTAKKPATKATSKATAKKSATKATSKATVKKSTTKATSKKADNKPVIVEYYDLPYRYNQTVVKLLAQTPDSLFIYWDISDEDRENYKRTYGNNFFEKTKPVLIIHNETLKYSFEVDINDFANSWYVQVNDSKCNYKIELGRRPIVFNDEINKKINNNYINISSSNNIESPNDKILFNVNLEDIKFENVKTQEIKSKAISKILFMPFSQQMNNIYDLYKNLYKEENLENVFNPSSGNPSSNNFTNKLI